MLSLPVSCYVHWALRLLRFVGCSGAATTMMVTGSSLLHAHDIYTGVFNFAGVNCCHGQDCARVLDPKDFIPQTNGYLLRSTGETVPLSTTGFSPDGNWHICRRENDHGIRCLLVPAGGS